MKKHIVALAATLALGVPALFANAAAAAESLHLLGRTDRASCYGDFDHFGVDLKGNRFFLAGEDGGTLEVLPPHPRRG